MLVTADHSQIAPASPCPNCGAPPAGAFCSRCGQKAGHFNPSLREFVHDAVHELLHVDGRLFQSVRVLLTRPGFLTREHFEGRRARYLSPIRLYLIFSLLYFGAAASVAPDQPLAVNVTVTETEPGELQALGYASEQELNSAVDFALTKGIPRAMFVLVPLFGALVWLVNRRSGWKYPQHVYFALHVHAALFGLGVLAEASKLLPDAARVGLGITVAASQLAYVVLAQRRTYGTSLPGSIGRMAAAGVVYVLAIMVAALLVVAPLFLS